MADDPDFDLIATDPELLDALRTVRARAHAPYSDFRVAAIIDCADGSRVAGCNVETAHFKSICAEASAISAMVAGGHGGIRRVWILGSGEDWCTPCGDCRQRIAEFGDSGTDVLIVRDSDGRARRFTLDELLPERFVLRGGVQ